MTAPGVRADFIIGGAQKAGAGSLFKALRLREPMGEGAAQKTFQVRDVLREPGLVQRQLVRS